VTIIHTQAGLGEAFFMGALPSPASRRHFARKTGSVG